MASDKPEEQTSQQMTEADFEKAFQELAKGEQTATALENQLNAMEAKIEALLAQAEKEQQERQNLQQANAKPNGHESSRQE